MPFRRRPVLALPALLLAAPALAQAQRPLRFVPQADVTILDPVFTTAYITRTFALMVHDQLFGLDSQLRPQPQMVEGWTASDDRLSWRFVLREGLRFGDGEPVRGRDCVASIRRWAQRDPLGQVMMARMAEMAADGDRAFTLRLQRPFGPLLETLAKLGPPALFIMPERLAEQDANRALTEVVGCGPFRFLPGERVVGARLAVERNPFYLPRLGGEADWAAGPKRAHFERVEWHVMPDPATAANALRAGEVDWWENPPNDLLPSLRRAREVKVVPASPLGVIGVGIFNTLHPPFDKAAVRRAVLRAMSQEDFMIAAAGTEPGRTRTGVGVFTPGTPLANDEALEAITAPRDLEQARRALREAGYAGERVTLLSPADQPILAALGEVQRDLFTRLGMPVDHVVSDWGTLVQRRARREPPAQGGWNMFHTTWVGMDAINPGVMPFLRGNGAQAWFGWPDIPTLEEARLAWFDATEQPAQQAAARRIQRLVMEEAPYLPTGQYFSSGAMRRNLEGALTAILGMWNVRRV